MRFANIQIRTCKSEGLTGVTNLKAMLQLEMWYMKIHVLKSLNKCYANYNTFYNKTST